MIQETSFKAQVSSFGGAKIINSCRVTKDLEKGLPTL
jgi:hypothetical protein